VSGNAPEIQGPLQGALEKVSIHLSLQLSLYTLSIAIYRDLCTSIYRDLSLALYVSIYLDLSVLCARVRHAYL
jgi:hypothetical protein